MAKSLGEFEFIVLAALMRVGEGAYGVTVRRMIDDTIDRKVSMGAVYSTLDRLERKGLVSSRFGDPTPERGGKAKRYFRIEEPGIAALDESVRVQVQMTSGLHLGSAT